MIMKCTPDPKTENYVKVSHRGFTGNIDLSWKFTPNAYLGDDYRLLSWQAESSQQWAYREKTRALEVLPRGDVTTFRARIIDMPTALAPRKPREIEFAVLERRPNRAGRPLGTSPPHGVNRMGEIWTGVSGKCQMVHPC